MKKILCLLTAVMMCILLAACGAQTPENKPAQDDVVVDAPAQDDEPEIKIDYIAEQLGLTDESNVMYGLIGAIAGKQYRNGNVELYQFEENSEYYKSIIDGSFYLTAAAHKKGVVLVFALGVEVDTDLVDAFNALDF